MRRSKSGQQQPPARHYEAGQIYSFRTSPASEFSPKSTGRYAALKVLGIKNGGVYYVVLDGVFDHHPDMSETSNLPWLHNRKTARPGPACRCSDVTWNNDLLEFQYVGSVTLSRADEDLMLSCGVHGPWSGADAEREWRWRNDRAALEEEIRLVREAREARRAAEEKRNEERVNSLGWQELLKEQPFSRWDQHPPFPDREFTEAAREKVRSLVRELQSLGKKPRKSEVRALLKSAVEWFNAKDAEFGNVIETEEREDICALLTEIASVAGHPSLASEVDGWRQW